MNDVKSWHQLRNFNLTTIIWVVKTHPLNRFRTCLHSAIAPSRNFRNMKRPYYDSDLMYCRKGITSKVSFIQRTRFILVNELVETTTSHISSNKIHTGRDCVSLSNEIVQNGLRLLMITDQLITFSIVKMIDIYVTDN